ncbi:hypothetical protein ACQUQU_03735 [Thalassolituus sp. LLYu03]|uniref:hypothetical protein n=1 Tax=Thalassolituus sp. LLYu03 TaxID=3421656 RepID=UPI003D2A9D3E
MITPLAMALESEPYLQGNSYPPFAIPDDDPYVQYLPEHTETEPGETRVESETIERSRTWLADYLNRLSGNIDSFFVDSFFSEDIIEDDVKGTRAKLSFYTRRVLGDPVDYKFGISVKLVLPNTNDKLNLLISSEEDDTREADPIESVENVEYSSALRYIINESDQWKTNIDTGIKWGVPPDPFVRFRARRYAYLSEWELKGTQRLFYFTSNGWGEDTSLQMDYPLNTEKLFRINAKAGYQLNDDYFKLSYDAGLYHELSRTSALAYVAGASGDTEQSATFHTYTAGVRYRQLIYSNWVYGEVEPQFLWDRDKDYRTTPVIMFRIESVIAHD